jgi:uncharacterized protein YneF (UPF0154 family)
MKNWKAIIGVLLVFVLGMVAGGLVTLGVIRHQLGTRGPQAMVNFVVRRLSWELRLDAAQREQLRTIVADTQQEIRTARRQVQPQIEQTLAKTEERIRAMLRQDQQEKFDKLLAERKGHWKP